jgi:hypothetical protein
MMASFFGGGFWGTSISCKIELLVLSLLSLLLLLLIQPYSNYYSRKSLSCFCVIGQFLFVGVLVVP